MKQKHGQMLGLVALGVVLFSGPSTFSQQVFPCLPPPSGVVVWYEGETNTLDHIGNLPAIWVGAPSYASGEVHNAFNLTSTNYVQLTNNAVMNQFTNAITIELWMKSTLTNNNSDWRALVAKGNDSWRLMCTAGAKTVYIALNGTSPVSDLRGVTDVNDGQWHHVAATYDGHTTTLYVDGVVDASESATGAISQNFQPVEIGADSNPPVGHYNFTGRLDEVAIYNRALTECEIQSIYLCGPTGKCQ